MIMYIPNIKNYYCKECVSSKPLHYKRGNVYKCLDCKRYVVITEEDKERLKFLFCAEI